MLRQFPLINLPSPLVSTPLNQLRDRELSEVETRQPGYILCEKSPYYSLLITHYSLLIIKRLKLVRNAGIDLLHKSKIRKNPTLPKLCFVSPSRKRGGVGGGVLGTFAKGLILNTQHSALFIALLRQDVDLEQIQLE